MNAPRLLPDDDYNRRLAANVHPADYRNPRPAETYNLVVIGAGTAGLVTAAGAAGLGAKVALVERAFLGGDCLNVGCVPSKAIISAARVAGVVRGAGEFGVQVPPIVQVDFARVMERMRKLRSDISPHDSVKRFTELGIDVFLGQGRFLDNRTVEVEGAKLRFRKAVVCTGARASAPPIAGIDEVDYLTNETVFSLTQLPKRLGIIGAGPVGCEMAQTFARLGSEVLLVESMHGILPREDPEAAEIVRESLMRDRVKLLCCGKDLKLARADNGTRMTVESHGTGYDEIVDQLLVAVGRAPNVEGLDLEKVGVTCSNKGVTVNDNFQTTNPRIYAAGDICSPYQFTHAADFMARAVIRNALFGAIPMLPKAKAGSLIIPWCTYTSPELAHVGLSPVEAERRGIAIDTYRQDMSGVDRAILEGETAGLVKIHTRKSTDIILGATIVAENAGDMIAAISMAMTHKIGLGKVGNVIHPYPTQADAIRKVGDAYARSRLTPAAKALFNKWFSWSR